MPVFQSRHIPAILLFFLCGFLNAQTPTFQKILADSTDTRAYDVTELPDGYLLAGSTTEPGALQSDGVLIRTDLNGEVIWQRRYNSYGTDEFRAARPANGGGFIAVGSASGAGAGSGNCWIVRVDENGNHLWNKTIGQNGFLTLGLNIIPIADGYIVSGLRITNTAQTTRSFVARIDNDGNTLWSTIPFVNRYNALNMQFVKDGLIYGCGSGQADLFAEKVEGVWAALDLETGALVKSFRYYAQEYEVLNSIRPTADGHLIMAGWTHPYGAFVIDPSYVWVQKTTTDGEVLWSKTYRVPSWQHNWGYLDVDADGGVMLNIYLNFRLTNNSVDFDEGAALFKLDADDGQPLWNRRFSGGEFSHFNKVQHTADGGWVAIGGIKNAPLAPYGFFVAKTDPAGYMSDCCSSQWPDPQVADLADTLMAYLPTAINFAESRIEPEPMVESAVFVSTDVCVYGTAPTIQETLYLCPGESVVLGGVTYSQPGTVVVGLPTASDDCDTLATYTIEWLPQVSIQDTFRVCPGETVTLQGTVYDQPGVVELVLPGAGDDCDTLATYVIQWLSDNQPNTISLSCPADLTVAAASGASTAVIEYDLPFADSDCPCPGLNTTLVSGIASGSEFPPGQTVVCYRADDACGNSATCCFTVNVTSDEEPCDVKTIGCLRFELLGIQQDAAQNRAYRVRVVNNCSAALQFVYLEVPDGVNAYAPANNAIYTAPSGRTYLVRNPNYSPMYSVRFKPQGAGIALGESDVFRYALPPQTDVDYINAAVRLSTGAYLETHLNTFGCPVTVDNNPRPAHERSKVAEAPVWRVFPNPVAGGAILSLEGPELEDAWFELRDMTGRLAFESRVQDNRVVAVVPALPAGVYGYRIVVQGKGVSSGRLLLSR